ncbi:nitrous oxide reductase accessory protein NosL [Halomonas saccharevitans]|uniref:Copper chaperone NosL n=1 Tax=Halomonas saccharevitans TaxID=416872 RepID=A0A1I6XBE9_9GAMM|nr:nitrous oxide reductase accessory protein NosL [Halomonas saccharevitans]SFT35302.1 copper chaperone NosL [Halomonas saccharevitans]
MPRLPILLTLLLVLLTGCSESDPETLAAPVPIADGDSCHVCGMLIQNFPGPKGEAFLKGQDTPSKFCSTLELFTFLKQPENETRLSHAYVHDIGKTTWQQPADEAFVPASDAWYVVGHDRRGAMGHTLASFAERDDAEAFREEHGGQLVAYEEIDLDLLGRLGRGELGGDIEGMKGMDDQGAMETAH